MSSHYPPTWASAMRIETKIKYDLKSGYKKSQKGLDVLQKSKLELKNSKR